MRTALLILFSALTPTLAHAATHDVNVCVRIEEKTWARDGTAPAPGQQADPRAAPQEPQQPQPSATTPAAPPAPGAETDHPNAPPFTGGTPDPFEEPTPANPDPRASEPPSQVSPVVSPVPRERIVNAEDADDTVIDPVLYLKRLIEYQVTHEPGFASVASGCGQTLSVELYPVKHGWTVFARYSGNEREEKVDVVRLDELGVFAERVTLALLRDKSISETLKRTTVLRADSDLHVRRVKTATHFLLGMGSSVRVGELPTAPNSTAPAEDELRVETPLDFTIGARNKFRGWALDATGQLDIGLTARAARLTAGGGHVDYSVGLGASLHFLAYADPDAVNTFYYGGGGSFEVSRYQSQGPRDASGYVPSPGGLWGGGLDVDLVLGYEFMRTSTLHFFVQGTLALPAYLFDTENDQTRIHAYIPSGNAELGLLF